MSAVAVLASALAALALGPGWLARRLQLRADPRTLAALSLVTLVGFGLLPLGWLVCLAGIFGQLGAGHRGLCQLSTGPLGLAQAVTYATAAALGLATLAVAARHGRSAWRAELRGPARLAAVPRAARSGHTVWVVPAAEPVAFTGGLVRTRSIVSTGLLGLLDGAEQEAVLEHEAAHQRAGHPRALLVGATVAALYGWLPPVRRAWTGLRRALEAVADDEAARTIGARELVSALAKVVVAQSPAPAAGFADPADLRYRIERLTKGPFATPVCSAGAAGAAGMLSVLLGWAVCAAAHIPSAPAGAVGCLIGLGWVTLAASRPWAIATRGPRAHRAPH